MNKSSVLCAKERLFDALYTLLKEKSYREIKVTELIVPAQINRTTFYKNFSSVSDLFEKAQARLCDALRTLELSRPKNREELRCFSKEMIDQFLDGNKEDVFLLGGDNGNVLTFWKLGDVFAARMKAEAEALGLEKDPGVRKNLVVASGFLSSMLCYLTCYDKLSVIWRNPLQGPYDVKRSFFENAAVELQKKRGGSAAFHYDLILAYVHHYDEFIPKITVTQLLETAGIHRTEFYLYYRNLEDFHACYSAAMYNCGALYVRCVCEADADTAVEVIRGFFEMNYVFVQRALQRVMDRGHLTVYVTLFVGAVLGSLGHIPLPDDPFITKENEQAMLYYVGANIVYAMLFYTKKLDVTTLREKLHGLDNLRAQLGLGKKN